MKDLIERIKALKPGEDTREIEAEIFALIERGQEIFLPFDGEYMELVSRRKLKKGEVGPATQLISDEQIPRYLSSLSAAVSLDEDPFMALLVTTVHLNKIWAATDMFDEHKKPRMNDVCRELTLRAIEAQQHG